MGVSGKKYTTADVEGALFRSAGVKLDSYAYGPATNPDPAAGFRSYKKSGKGVGHVYVHVDGPQAWGKGGVAKKSRYADRPTMIGVIVELLNHADGQAALVALDADPGSQQWLHGATVIAVTGSWYGCGPNETTKKKIITAAINLRSHGDALFISSTYPETLQTSTLNPNAPAFVPGGGKT